MKLEGIHHITCITGDAPRNVDFYARVMGLRLVKKSVNQDDPTVYHLFFGDEEGAPGNDLTFFEYPGAAQGRAGAGMIHRVVWRIGSDDSLGYWADRLGDEGVETRRENGSLVFADPEGLEHELGVFEVPDPPLIAHSAEVPDEHALQGFEAARAYTRDPAASRPILEAMEMEPRSDTEWEARGGERGGRMIYDPSGEPGSPGAGTVHHIAWSVGMDEQVEWRDKVSAAGARPTPVIDRFWFRSVYYREPSGVLFELATRGPGFTADEPLETLGEHLTLPPDFEQLRDRLEGVLTPLPDTRQWRRAGGRAPAG
jgi:glyoxalase family protein